MATASKEILSKLLTAVNQHALSEVEEQRLVKDLTRVIERLDKREYARSDFVGNTFNVPDRTKEFYGNLSSYFQHVLTWERIFQALQYKTIPKIIDLCPGWAPKLALSLWYIEYAGEIVLVDKDKESTAALIEFMQLFRPKYSFSINAVDLLHEAPPVSADLVIANHIADDLALEIAAERFGYKISDLYADEESYKKIWQMLLDEPHDLKERTVEVLTRTILSSVKSSGHVVLTQYSAYLERLLGLKPVVQFAQSIITETVKRLIVQGFILEQSKVDQALLGYSGVFSSKECWILKRQV